MLALLAAALLFAYIPGPALLYAAAQTVARGRKAGLLAALGLHVGGLVHVVAAAAGLSALFHAVPALYVIVKLIGSGYLILIGLKMIRQAWATQKLRLQPVAPSQKSGRMAFIESVTVEVLNPKTALFFIAFLPQFVDPAAAFPVWLQFLILGIIVNMMLSSADLVCVFFAGIVVDKLRQSSRLSRLMEGLGGTLLIGLGAHLALQKN
jgi:threonine/homoserine/homoserine lactone efflux protein